MGVFRASAAARSTSLPEISGSVVTHFMSYNQTINTVRALSEHAYTSDPETGHLPWMPRPRKTSHQLFNEIFNEIFNESGLIKSIKDVTNIHAIPPHLHPEWLTIKFKDE